MSYTYVEGFSDEQFVDFLIDKLHKHADTDMIDLHDDDTCCDHIVFEQLTLEDV
jgi:hypothetical protein